MSNTQTPRPKGRYIEEFTQGEVFRSKPWRITQQEIIEFASKFDPQPFHTDPVAAQDSIFGGLIASGFHSIAAAFRVFWDMGMFEGTSLGGPGADYVKWLRPIRPDQDLILEIIVKSARKSNKNPDRGVLSAQFLIYDSDNEIACDSVVVAFIRARPDK